MFRGMTFVQGTSAGGLKNGTVHLHTSEGILKKHIRRKRERLPTREKELVEIVAWFVSIRQARTNRSFRRSHRKRRALLWD